ncbi:MAG: class I SAM-dependent methyltransferase [Burkholderiaceae bacterium]|nr:MAG: class I SAM-dependent methyltransferase [Burkholderiaceae bacterium]
MSRENFKPIAIEAPSKNRWLFRLRCLLDLQLASLASPLRAALQGLQGRVLDIGAGESPWREWLSPQATYHGLDVQSAADYGMQAHQDITYYDGTVMPFEDASFEGAFCIEVLEHVPDPEFFVSEIARILKHEGRLVLSVPWSARRHHVPHDYHRFTRERLQALFESHGFAEVVIEERGNDIASIASKCIVVAMRLVKPANLLAYCWTLPMALLWAPISIVLLGLAHLSFVLPIGAKEDPLGYFLTAQRWRK